MRAVLEAVREEIAKAEEAKQAIDEQLERLRAIETIAVDMDGGQAPADAAPPEPQPPRRADRALAAARAQRGKPAKTQRRKAAGAPSDDQLEAAALTCLRRGGATPTAVQRELSTTSDRVLKRVQELFAHWERDAKISSDGSIRGNRTFALAEETASPEPEAPASTQDDAGAEEWLPDHLLDAEPEVAPPEPTVEVGDYDDVAPRKRTGATEIPDFLRADADKIVGLCSLDRRSVDDLVEVTGMARNDVKRLVNLLAKRGEIQPYGSKPKKGTSTHVACYRARPSLEEQGVTVKQADRPEDITVAIRAELREHGRMSIARLAAEIVRHPRDVAEGVQTLVRDGAVVKHKGFPDGEYELVAA